MFGVFKRNQEENKRQTEEGVKRSRERWFGRVLGLLRSSRMDDALWDELEEILISSDVGGESSIRIIEDLKSQVREERIADPELAFERL
jgi:fused signal recognition particle receptor